MGSTAVAAVEIERLDEKKLAAFMRRRFLRRYYVANRTRPISISRLLKVPSTRKRAEL